MDALAKLIAERRDVADAENPEIQRFKKEQDRLHEQIRRTDDKDPEIQRLREERDRLGEEMERIRKAYDDKDPEIRRLNAEYRRCWEEADRIEENSATTSRGSFKVIRGGV